MKVYGPRWTMDGGVARAHWSAGSSALQWSQAHHGYIEMKRGSQRSSPRSSVARAMTEEGRRWEGTIGAVELNDEATGAWMD
jgi:hypothetical protein